MQIEIPFEHEVKVVEADLPESSVTVAQAKDPPGAGTWGEVVGEALAGVDPFGAKPIRQEDLSGKKVAVLTDDWNKIGTVTIFCPCGANSRHEQLGAHMEAGRELTQVLDGQRPVPIENLRSHAGVDAEQASQVGGVHIVLRQQVTQRVDPAQVGGVDPVVPGLVGLDELYQCLQVKLLALGQLP